MRTSINFKASLQEDNIYVSNELKPMSELVNMPCRKGLTHAIISNGKLVNVVSQSYSHLSNELFFTAVEAKLADNDINYVKRSINREDRAFAVDYILSDERYHIDIKNGMDKLRPMLRFTNSYDGSARTSGRFGFFREVCSNGLHVAHTQIGFSMKHKGDMSSLVMPEISRTVRTFIDNEYYTLQRKFELLAERRIDDLEGFVKMTSEELKLFKYATSETNPAPSQNARIVMESIRKESNLLGSQPNLWLGYNAFNELIHNKLKKPFDAQKQADSKVFDFVMNYS